MKVNNLRIGNLVKDYRNRIVTIKQYTIHNDIMFIGVEENEGMFLTDDIFGIELTEEWLIKFGFALRGIYYHFPKYDIFKLEQYKNKNAFWLRHGSESIDCTRINFVHQIQNLCWCLCGEELKTTL